jgi:hypothetical protein
MEEHNTGTKLQPENTLKMLYGLIHCHTTYISGIGFFKIDLNIWAKKRSRN